MSGELLSNDGWTVGFGSSQLGLGYASIAGEEAWGGWTASSDGEGCARAGPNHQVGEVGRWKEWGSNI